MLLCNRCFKPKGECNCSPTVRGYVEIDDAFVPHIQLLNWKGYETKMCCSGHIEDKWFRPFVTFAHRYNFDTSNLDFFTYNGKYCGFYFSIKDNWETIKDIHIREQIADIIRNSFLNWIQSLPNIKEIPDDFIVINPVFWSILMLESLNSLSTL